MADKIKDQQVVQLKRVRLSFPTLIEKKSTVSGGKEKFSANFIIDPSTPEGKANIAAVTAAIGAAEMAEFKKTGVVKNIDDPKRVAFRRGEKFKNGEGEPYEGYADMVAVSTNAEKRPTLFNRKKELVAIDEIGEVFMGGYTVDAVVRFFCVSSKEKGGHGLFAQVNAIRSLQEGKTFGNAVVVTADDFDDVEGDAPGDALDDLLA